MSKVFIDIMRGFREFAEATGKEKELFPIIIKAVGNCESKAECKSFDGNIYVVNAENVSRAADDLFEVFYGLDGGENKNNVVLNCRLCESDRIEYSDDLFACKKYDFDELNEKEQSKQANERVFRSRLKEYIINFKPKAINEKKNLWFDITPQGKFIAIKKSGDETIICNLSTTEQVMFDFLCFTEKNKFRQFVKEERNSANQEKPLIVLNFLEFLDKQFDYIYFLKKKIFNRIIIVI